MRFIHRLIALLLTSGSLSLASAQVLTPDFTGPGLAPSLLPYAQPGFSYFTQHGTLSLRFDTPGSGAQEQNGALQWSESLAGDFVFRATVDVSRLEQLASPGFMNAGPYLSFASGATALVGPWKDGSGASLNGGYMAPAYVGAPVYSFASPLIDIVFERRGTTITEWAGVAGSGQLAQLLTVSGPDFSGPALVNFYLYVRQPNLITQGIATFSNVSVTAVPEPATWALCLLGCVVCWIRVRRA